MRSSRVETQRIKPVDYDLVAPIFDRRYESSVYDATFETLVEFIGEHAGRTVAEVGCGTGHWLAAIERHAATIIGIEPSAAMLEAARSVAPNAMLVRGRAEALPCKSGSLDRIFAINAFHHFLDKHAFLSEARRALRLGGAVMSIGIDPHTGQDQWWVYDYFPAALAADRERYPATAEIREWLVRAGFSDATTSVAQHIPAVRPYAVAVEQGKLDRRSTSQLMVISDAEWEAGLRRLEAERPVLRSDLRLYMTTARVPVS